MRSKTYHVDEVNISRAEGVYHVDEVNISRAEGTFHCKCKAFEQRIGKNVVIGKADPEAVLTYCERGCFFKAKRNTTSEKIVRFFLSLKA